MVGNVIIVLSDIKERESDILMLKNRIDELEEREFEKKWGGSMHN